MGNPAADDDHPQHGELPAMPYNEAYIKTGSDGGGEYIAAGGMVRVRNSFSFDYTANPEVKLYAGDSVLNISMKITNNRLSPLEYQYLCHINFKPRDGAELVYSVPADASRYKIYRDVFDGLHDKTKLAACLDTLIKNPASQNKVGESWQCYNPEIVQVLDYNTDGAGWGHCLQYTDKGADYAAFRKAELPLGVRWIARTGDEDAMGMLLPATSDHKGRANARRTGQMKTLAPKTSM